MSKTSLSNFVSISLIDMYLPLTYKLTIFITIQTYNIHFNKVYYN